eukprot:TRINITY_DN2057_c0_g1_i2.p2 TRINITY_DN2057_c0_g1~~TRINITY_DN2057_c0_g1_i2.p2  ORF type:complete len:511 (+),score=46.49 TRINITY_DN2057_c0_g1_i2:1108-2640(+)
MVLLNHDLTRVTDLLEQITEQSSQNTLLSLLKQEQSPSTISQVYHMTHSITKKPLDVKTKVLADYKVAIVKDQSVIEQLVKKEMLEKYFRMLLSSISHEVRNPLNAMQGYLNLISELNSVECIRIYAKKLKHSAQYIDYAVNGACYLTMAESGTVVVQPEIFYLKQVLNEMTEFVDPSIEGKEVRIGVEMATTVPEVVFSDKKKYKLILFHLLVNAAKYTRVGYIGIGVEFDKENGILKTTVRDTGCGISPEKIKKLFSLFSNIDDANQFNPQGMGLGLTLCRRLAKIMGGDIEVESILGRGSLFTFTIKCYDESIEPMTRAEPSNATNTSISNNNEIKLFIPKPIERPPATVETISKFTECCTCSNVLIVDDEPTNRLVVRSYLKGCDLIADEAENGLISVNLVKKKANNPCCKKYKMIFMDINMPVMDGTEATQHLMQFFEENRGTKAPIIAVTAATLETRKDVLALLSVGFTDVFQKPVSKDEFITRISKYIEQFVITYYWVLLLLL